MEEFELSDCLGSVIGAKVDVGAATVQDEFMTEIEQRAQVGVREVVCLVWVGAFVGGFGEIAGGWTGSHQRVAGEGHVFVVCFDNGSSTEVIGVFATW